MLRLLLIGTFSLLLVGACDSAGEPDPCANERTPDDVLLCRAKKDPCLLVSPETRGNCEAERDRRGEVEEYTERSREDAEDRPHVIVDDPSATPPGLDTDADRELDPDVERLVRHFQEFEEWYEARHGEKVRVFDIPVEEREALWEQFEAERKEAAAEAE